jgi:hypothetical protein
LFYLNVRLSERAFTFALQKNTEEKFSKTIMREPTGGANIAIQFETIGL